MTDNKNNAKGEEKMSLSEAVKIVNEAIRKDTERLEKISKEEGQNPIMVEGETFQDYYCQLMVDPKEVAEIFLRYCYPTWRMLEEDAPSGMWEELGRKFGIKVVSSVDL